MFLAYKAEDDFVGMDMARKCLQMGYTRARRYANHRSGQKYVPGTRTLSPRDEDAQKAESARIFQEKWLLARTDKDYLRMKKRHRAMYEGD